MNAPQDKPVPQPHTSTDILVRVADELQRVTDMAGQLQALVGRALSPNYVRSDQDLKDLQSLDLLTQSTQGLGQFLHALSLKTPNEWVYASLAEVDQLGLKDMAGRLSGEQNTPEHITQNSNDAEDGDLDLF